MITFPGCKINLGLSVLSKRPDGFHDIETVFYPVPFCDILEIMPSPGREFGFRQSGLSTGGSPEDNLCVRAYRLLKEQPGVREVDMMLHKIIPAGSGLGGGSSDAAATLLALDRIFGLGLSEKELQGFANRLGSDCAFFLKNEPRLATGRGEILGATGLRIDRKVVIVIPPLQVSTAWAYSVVKPVRKKRSIADSITQPVERWKEILLNDFEVPVFQRHPELAGIKKRLYELGAEYAAMSGSGSAVFGLFSEVPDACLKDSFPGCTVYNGKLGSR